MYKIITNIQDDKLLHVIAHCDKKIVKDNGKYESIEVRQEIVGIELIFKDDNGNLSQYFLRHEIFDYISNFVLGNNWKIAQITKDEYEAIKKDDDLPF